MARTKASVGAKVSSGKSSKARCSAAPPSSTVSSGSGEKSSRSHSGGNPVCPRETPKWQKPITNFFISNQTPQSDESDNETEVAGASNSKSIAKRNVIQSDHEDVQTDDEDVQTEKPINKELDETIELEPLTGEDSHKIDQYYKNKDKGKGKKSANKENINGNIERNSVKRNLEDVTCESEQVNKKIKVN